MDYRKIIGTSSLLEQQRLAGVLNEEEGASPLKVGDNVKVVKGLKARGISKGAGAKVVEIKDWERGAVVVYLKMIQSGKTYGMQVRHRNRLKDMEVSMHTGDPTQKLVVRKVAVAPGTVRSKQMKQESVYGPSVASSFMVNITSKSPKKALEIAKAQAKDFTSASAISVAFSNLSGVKGTRKKIADMAAQIFDSMVNEYSAKDQKNARLAAYESSKRESLERKLISMATRLVSGEEY
jgi:hypothetical protein